MSVAEKYGRQPGSIARLIKKYNLMTKEDYYFYVGYIENEKQSKPANANERWTEVEEQRLMEMFNSNATLDDIADAHKRTPGAIVARIARLTNKDRETIQNHFYNKKG